VSLYTVKSLYFLQVQFSWYSCATFNILHEIWWKSKQLYVEK